jgi:exonuclease III
MVACGQAQPEINWSRKAFLNTGQGKPTSQLLAGQSNQNACVLHESGAYPPTGWICIWRVGHLDISIVRGWIYKAIGKMINKVCRLCRSTQNSNSRFDLFVKLESTDTILQLLKEKAHLAGWYVRLHIPYAERQRSRIEKRIKSPSKVLASWNVNSVRGKSEEIAWYLSKERVAVLAIQETLHKGEDWRMRIGKYQCIESPMHEGKVGERGVALAIAPHLIAHETGTRSPFWIWARIIHPTFPSGLIVGSVYVISHKGSVRQEAIKGLQASASSILKRHAGIPVVLMGDWNMDSCALDNLLNDWKLPLTRLKCRGAARTRWCGSGTLRDLDHIVVSTEALNLLANANVCRSWDISDHWPIHSFFKKETSSAVAKEQTIPGTSLKLKQSAIKEHALEIAHHNMWEVLEREVSLDTEEGARVFLDTSITVAKKVGAAAPTTSNGNTQQKEVHLSGKCRRAINSRRKVFQKWNNLDDSEEKDTLWVEYLDLKKKSKKLIQEEKKAQWQEFISKGAESLANNEWHKAWKWIKCLRQHSNTTLSGPQPVKDKDGNLVMDPENIIKAWATHYSALAKDETGHSRDPTYWVNKVETDAEAISSLDESITWKEANLMLHAIKGRKAAGFDGFPPEWFKVMAEDPHTVGLTPQSPMAKVFLKVIQGVWEKSSITEGWNKAILVSIPKKGDPTDMDNYRGISLIGIALKLLCGIVIRRIRDALESRRILVPEQAGFRSREECMGQVIALHEVIQRRKLCGQPTYAAFIDFKKAYDTVPHEALLRKLWCNGIQGRTLAFIKALYQNSRIAVRVGNTFSETFSLERGLRQGCPMSPILFDVFINDILQGNKEDGVVVPGGKDKLCGLMFADDVVLLAPDESKLRRLMHQVEVWADKWEMSIGAKKCGVMVCGESTNSLNSSWTLQGQEVPVVDSYTYLGIEIHNDLDLTKSAKAISVRVNKALMSLRPALVNSSIPVGVKVLMIKSLIMPIATLGGELLGMNQAHAKHSQSLINKGLQWILSGDRAGQGSMGMAAVGLELGIAPLSALLAGCRTRAWFKYRTLHTWVATLVKEIFKHRKISWTSGTSRWLKRFQVDGASDSRQPSKAKAKEVVSLSWNSKLEKDSTQSLNQYLRKGFEETRIFNKLALTHTDSCKGFVWLTRMRTGALWTGIRAAKAGLIEPRWARKCPSCKENCQEDIPHILLECKKFSDEIKGYIQPIMDKLVEQSPALSREELATLIIGGQVDGVLSSDFWLGRATYLNTDTEAPCLRVVKYLQCVMPLRMGYLWSCPSPQIDLNEMGTVVPHNYSSPNHIVEVVIPWVPGPMSQSPNG